jgi:hypothetical protein
MIKGHYASVFLIGLCALAACTPIASVTSDPAELSNPASLFPYSDAAAERLRKGVAQPAKSTFALELGPKLVEVKATYTEQRGLDSANGAGAKPPASTAPPPDRYFDLLARSSRFDGKLVGESELAYSGSPGADVAHQLPAMSRLTLRGNWGSANYGASYRSFGSGFVSAAGLKFDNPRDEREAWGEYDFKLFRFKSSLGESSERSLDTGQLSLTKTAATSFKWNQGGWSALFLSSYSITGQNEVGIDKTTAFSNGLSLAYRPTSFLTIEPGFNLKEEWSHVTGLKTETPSGGIALVSNLFRDVSLTGRASFARGFSEDPLKETSLMNTAASLNWRLGRSFLGDQALSFHFEYNHQLNAGPNAPPLAGFNGLIQWKLAGF